MADRRARRAQPSPFADRDPAQLGADALLETIGNRSQRKPRPEKGWRRSLYDLTGGRWNPGLSPEEQEEQRLIDLIRGPLPSGVMNIMVWSQKGGVGKTTVWTTLGVTTASCRTDKVLGLDVNPDGGSASVRVPRTTDRTILDLRDALRQRPLTPVEFDQYVNHAAHRYDSIVMPPGKKPAHPLSSSDYDMLVDGLEARYPYKLVFTDCGTNLSDPVMDSVFAHAHQMVVVTTTVKDEATVTAGGLEALIREGREDLVRNAITVLVEKAPKDPDVEVQRLIEGTASTIRDYFERLTKTVIPVPYDSRVRIGDVFDPAAVSQRSRMAHLRLAANVVQSLGGRPPV